MGVESSMAAMEHKLVELIIRMSRIWRCLTPSQCLLLANDLLESNEIEKEVIKFKEQRYKQKFKKASLGKKLLERLQKKICTFTHISKRAKVCFRSFCCINF